ncbi:Holliday junction ATP-dependent DNA helicase RuvA [uncultured archaeon]|nr:Holliday junction ATP-dependent DNA helicase RuvA [uncultured archaeon]
MISHISGDIAYCGDGFVVIDLNGMGYQVNVTAPALTQLRDAKEKVKLFTHLHVREDALTLYGFMTPGELAMFKNLISVTRIGPQIALNILSQIKTGDLAAAIIQEDEKVLRNISGVGPKNAKRLILELRDRMNENMQNIVPASTSNFNNDAVSALVSLGFAQREAREAVEFVSQGMKQPTVQALIKAALLKLK